MNDDKRFSELPAKDEPLEQPLADADAAVTANGDAPENALGTQLRAARNARGLSIADCAARLHLPVGVLERLEAGAYGEPEHFVFLRGTLQGYARFLGLPEGCCNAALRAVAPPAQPTLVSVERTSPTRWLVRRYGTAATYIVLTGMIVVPLVWLGLRGGLERPVARTVSLQQTPAIAQLAPPAGRGRADPAGTVKTATVSQKVTPFRASMTPFAAMGFRNPQAPPKVASAASTPPTPVAKVAPAPAPDRHALTIAAAADCWFEVTDAEGDKLESGMLHAGDVRIWHPEGRLHVTLGNVGAVTVTDDGKRVNLDAFQRGHVAHLALFGSAAHASGDN
jgi:cytoskeleton protein RodZ